MKQYLYRWGIFNVVAHARNRRDADAVVWGFHGRFATYQRLIKSGEQVENAIGVAYKYE